MSAWALVGAVAAGGLGAGARYVVDALVMRGRVGRFPLGILVVNVSGSFLLGLLTGLALPVAWLTVLGVGLLGGYTTFSAVSVETVLQLQHRRGRRALWNGLGTLALTVLVAGLGLAVGGLIPVGY